MQRPAVAPTRILVAVQPALWCELLCAALDRQPGIEVMGSANTEDELHALMRRAAPAVVVLDYEALGPNSEGLIARLRRAPARARVLVLARRSGEEIVKSVLRAGAAGLVGKESTLARLVDAIRAVAAGQVWANREVTARVIEQLAAPAPRQLGEEPALTRREWDVLEAVSRGLRNREVARLLGVSEKTVKTHLNNIFAKTRLRGRFALALWAQGQIQPKA